MGYLMLGIVVKGEREYIRLYDKERRYFEDYTKESVRGAIEDGSIFVDNLGIDGNGELVGTNGDISRYAKLHEGVTIAKEYPIVVCYKTPSIFNTINIFGGSLYLTANEVIRYAEEVGVANGKIVERNGNKFLSAISGTYDLVGGRLSDEISNSWNRLVVLQNERMLSAESSSKIDKLEKEYERKISKLRESEIRHKRNGLLDIAKVSSLINAISEIEDEIDVERIDIMLAQVREKFNNTRKAGAIKSTIWDSNKKEKFRGALKTIGKELNKTIKYINEEELHSDECYRRLKVINTYLDKLNNSL